MTKKLTCARIGCKNSATKWPKLSFAAEAMPDGPRATFDFPLPVCDAHASTDPAVYVGDDGWAQIVAGMAAQGKARPGRETLRVDFVPVQ